MDYFYYNIYLNNKVTFKVMLKHIQGHTENKFVQISLASIYFTAAVKRMRATSGLNLPKVGCYTGRVNVCPEGNKQQNTDMVPFICFLNH